MEIVSNRAVAAVLTEEVAYRAVRQALIASTRGARATALMHPGFEQGEIFGVKCAASPEDALMGLKIGAYWPRNNGGPHPPHSASIVLLDSETGRISTFVCGDVLHGFRTAASNAVATDALARHDSATLSLMGSGHQASFEARAICRIRRIERVLIAARNIDRAQLLATSLASCARVVQLTDARTACVEADILVTVTASRAPLLDGSWIRPGTHISAMGADQKGKQELPLDLLRRARLFADSAAQSVDVGEFQRIQPDFLTGQCRITDIGYVLCDSIPGRQSPDEITIYDSSGLALQDLHLAADIAERARVAGLTTRVPDLQ